MPEHELTFDYGDLTFSCSVVYTIIQDGDERVPEIQRIYFDEWVDEKPYMVDDAREAFYSDFAKGLVQVPR